MATIIITIEGGLVQSVHSSKDINYVIVNKDLKEEEQISEIYQRDSNLVDFFDILDSERNNQLLSDLVDLKSEIKELTIEEAKQVLIDNGYIDDFWTVDDIIKQAEDDEVELTEDEIMKVKTKLSKIDANLGMDWDSISMAISDVKEGI